MTPGQVHHVNRILNSFKTLMVKKYEGGVKEHGGNLYDRSPLFLVEQAAHEAIDQVVYLITLWEKMESIPECHEGVPDNVCQICYGTGVVQTRTGAQFIGENCACGVTVDPR